MEIDIRNFILDNIDEIKKMMLSKPQLNLLTGIIQRERFHGLKTSAFDVAVETGISIQSASSRLKKLHDIGWLKRERENDLTGGVYYIYYVDF